MVVTLALDSYDDLFSDFDVRDYGQRALSRDFLEELNMRFRKSKASSGSDILLLLPAALRSSDEETLIVGRLASFFAERSAHYARSDRRVALASAGMVLVGLGLLLGANLVARRLPALDLFNEFLLIPAWFFVWNGLERFLHNREAVGAKRRYYEALSGSRVSFGNIDGYRDVPAPSPEKALSVAEGPPLSI